MTTTTLDNIAALRPDMSYAAGESRELFGYYNPGDLGGGLFYYDPLSSDPDDGGLTIIPNGNLSLMADGRWKRVLFENEIDVRWFGAKTDGSDLTALLNSILNISSVEGILLDGGDYTLSASSPAVPLSVPTGKKLIFRNAARLVGDGALVGGIIECDMLQQCFGSDLSVTGLENTTVSVRWFGAVPDSDNTAGTDCLGAFTAALNAGAQSLRVYVPAAPFTPTTVTDSLGYRLSDTLVFDKQVEFFGDGQDKTMIRFYDDIAGFQLHFGASLSYLHDFSLQKGSGGGPQTYNDPDKHGILVGGNFITIERITVRAFSGDGISCQSNLTGDAADLTRLKDCWVLWCGRNGYYFHGGDANASVIDNCSAQVNSRWGFWDNGFLGNTFVGCHSATNGIIGLTQYSQVVWGGFVWTAILDDLVLSPSLTLYNTNIEPGVDPYSDLFWKKGTATGAVDTWSSATQYYTGGGYNFGDANQHGVAIGCYAEDDNQVLNASQTLIIAGFAAGDGSSYNSVANRQSFLTTPKFQARNNVDGIAMRMFSDPGTAYVGGINKAETCTLGWRFDDRGNGALFSLTEDYLDGGSLHYMSKEFADYYRWSVFGRNTSSGNAGMTQYGEVWFRRGYFISGFDNSARHVEHGTSAPPSGYYAQGDVVWNNNGVAGAPIAWRCTAQGNPGTWETVYADVIPAVVNLTVSSSHFSVNANLGKEQRLVLDTSTYTIDNPTNGTDGQRLRLRITQDGTGSRTVTFDTKYRFGTSYPTPTLSTGANKADYLEFVYNAPDDKWDCVNAALGF